MAFNYGVRFYEWAGMDLKIPRVLFHECSRLVDGPLIKISSGEAVWPNPSPPTPTSSPFAFPSFQFRLRLSLSLPLSSPRLFYPLLSFLFRPPSVPALLGSRSRCSFHSSPFPSELFDAIKKPEKEIYKMMSRCARLIRRCRGRGRMEGREGLLLV